MSQSVCSYDIQLSSAYLGSSMEATYDTERSFLEMLSRGSIRHRKQGENLARFSKRRAAKARFRLGVATGKCL